MKKLLVTHKKYGDRFALIDEDDYEFLSKFTWSLKKFPNQEYPRCNIWINGKRSSVYMHKLVLPKAKIVDHINGNGLDNRKENLREATKANNNRNTKKPKSGVSSIYKGVCAEKSKTSPWRAYITVDYKRIHLGSFKTQEQAAQAYNKAAIKYFGEYARLNVIK